MTDGVLGRAGEIRTRDLFTPGRAIASDPVRWHPRGPPASGACGAAIACLAGRSETLGEADVIPSGGRRKCLQTSERLRACPVRLVLGSGARAAGSDRSRAVI